MTYFTNYDVINENGNKLKMRNQACFSQMKINSNDKEVHVWIPSSGIDNAIHKKHYTKDVPFNEIERYINLLIKAGFNLTLDPDEYTFYEYKTEDGKYPYNSEEMSVKGYKVIFPIETSTNKNLFCLYYCTYIRYLYKKTGPNYGYYDSFIRNLYKLEENLPLLDYSLLVNLAEYTHDYNIGGGHSGVGYKIKKNIYKIPTVQERIEYIINPSSISIQESFYVKETVDKKYDKVDGNIYISKLLENNKFDDILEIFGLKEEYDLKNKIKSEEKVVTKKKNLRSRTISRVC